MSLVYQDFSGGMNLVDYDSRRSVNEYGYAKNVRIRNKVFEGINDYVRLYALSGLKQGIFTTDEHIILFIAGKAFYRRFEEVYWNPIKGFQLSSTANRIYTQEVPISSLNFGRILTTSDFSGTVELNSASIDGTPRGIVCQDGVNQPIIIFPDFTSRVIQDYAGWSKEIREYVPIGKHMAFINNILYVAAPDGKNIYRSVLGRPLDFVINIDSSGNKGGDASTTSFTNSYRTITILHALNTGQLFVGSADGCYGVELDWNSTIFGQPTHKYTPTLPVGVVNSVSFMEKLGDYVFIDKEGVRSFNAVVQLTNEGRNSIFSRKVEPLFTSFKQDPEQVCSIVHNNYSIFSVETSKGWGLLVYDNLRDIWVSFTPTSSFNFKQLSVLNRQGETRLLGISDSELYEVFPSTSENVTDRYVEIGTISSSDPDVELKATNARVVMDGGATGDLVALDLEVDGDVVGRVNKRLTIKQSGIPYPVLYPVRFKKRRINNLTYNLSHLTNLGWKIGLRVHWKGNAKLTDVKINVTPKTGDISLTQKGGSE